MLHPLLWWWPGFSANGDTDTYVPPIVVPERHPEHVFCYPVWSDATGVGQAPVWYGGSWRTRQPVGNVATNNLAQFARSTDLNPSSTILKCWLGKKRKVGAAVMPVSSCTPNALWRVTYAATGAGLVSAPLYQSAWLRRWPQYLSVEDARNFRVPAVHLLDAPLTAEYAQIEISDTGNPNGYVDVGRAQFAGITTPAHAMSVGAQLRLQDLSDIVLTDGNTEVSFARPKRRSWAFTIDRQTESEAFLQTFKMQADLGTTAQFMFIFDRYDDPRLFNLRSIFGTQRDLSGVDWPYSTALRSAHLLLEAL